MRITIPRLAVKLSRGGRLSLDHLVLRVKGGPAGAGLPSIGGVGGNGGDVILEAKNSWTLIDLSRKCRNLTFVASEGLNSRRIKVLGEKGKDTIIKVPVGVQVKDEEGQTLGELNKAHERLVIAKGAVAGTSETNFRPEKGQWKYIRLDLRLIADVGFVGFPNAGKSTLLRALSRAKPKVSSFPFTTLHPEVGILQFADYRAISAADLPGLIEGAYRNVGLGHEFLKHVERTSILLVVVDVSGFQLNLQSPFRDAFQTVMLLNKELELYNPDLLLKPAILCINKMDLPNSRAKTDTLLEKLNSPKEWCNFLDGPELLPEIPIKFYETFEITAIDKDTVLSLKMGIRRILDEITPIIAPTEVTDNLDKQFAKKTTLKGFI